MLNLDVARIKEIQEPRGSRLETKFCIASSIFVDNHTLQEVSQQNEARLLLKRNLWHYVYGDIAKEWHRSGAVIGQLLRASPELSYEDRERVLSPMREILTLPKFTP